MNTYILDTDILSLFQTGHAVVRQNVKAHAHQDLCVAIISVEEQLSGWYAFLRKTKRPDKLAWGYDRLTDNIASLAAFRVLSYNLQPMQRFDALRQQKLNVRSNDFRIAAIALENNATVVTRNMRDFKQIPGLTIEDCSQ